MGDFSPEIVLGWPEYRYDLASDRFVARYYDATIGRFISADTIVPQPFNPQSLNRYSYCLNNPLKYIDPSGHDENPYADQGVTDEVYDYATSQGLDVYSVCALIGTLMGWTTEYYDQSDVIHDLVGDYWDEQLGRAGVMDQQTSIGIGSNTPHHQMRIWNDPLYGLYHDKKSDPIGDFFDEHGDKILGVGEMIVGGYAMGLAVVAEVCWIASGVPAGPPGMVVTGGVGLLTTGPVAVSGYTVFNDGLRRTFNRELPSFNSWDPFGLVP